MAEQQLSMHWNNWIEDTDSHELNHFSILLSTSIGNHYFLHCKCTTIKSNIYVSPCPTFVSNGFFWPCPDYWSRWCRTKSYFLDSEIIDFMNVCDSTDASPEQITRWNKWNREWNMALCYYVRLFSLRESIDRWLHVRLTSHTHINSPIQLTKSTMTTKETCVAKLFFFVLYFSFVLIPGRTVKLWHRIVYILCG